MSENVVYLHPQPEPVAHYLRLGAFHRQVEKLLAAGRLPVKGGPAASRAARR